MIKGPPGPLLQWLNELLHQEPFSFLFYGVYWCIVLFFLSPFAGLALLLLTTAKFVLHVLGFLNENKNVNRTDKQLGVVITGCDSGFGNDLAFALADKGFVVFSGCLRKEALQQFQGTRIVAFSMDVTKDDQVQAAAAKVNTWLSKGGNYLHAVVNNAGIGHCGLVDWQDMASFQQDMDGEYGLYGNFVECMQVWCAVIISIFVDAHSTTVLLVNYFGMIRTVKAFLPLLKAQARDYKEARVVNVISMAGLVVGGFAAPYHGSKYAAEALSTSLRMELRPFGIQVITVNPSFHTSPLTTNMRHDVQQLWNELPLHKRNEYGEEFFQQVFRNSVQVPEMLMWRARVVQQELVKSVLHKNPPSQIIVGSDAKYSMMILRHFPVWLQDWMQSLVLHSSVKPKVMTE
jgi:NAD(P)-dependent dehydrogenase (short-subunit alcohol dehydrogenase family)